MCLGAAPTYSTEHVCCIKWYLNRSPPSATAHVMFTFHDAYRRFLAHFPAGAREDLEAGASRTSMVVFDQRLHFYRIRLGHLVPTRSSADCVDITDTVPGTGHMVLRMFRFGATDITTSYVDTPEMLDAVLAREFPLDGLTVCKRRKV